MKVSLKVSGKVQGVAFRYMTKFVADQLGVNGTVQNLGDGSVYIEANGSDEAVAKFIKEVRKSPAPMGHVTHCEQNDTPSFSPHKGFRILY